MSLYLDAITCALNPGHANQRALDRLEAAAWKSPAEAGRCRPREIGREASEEAGVRAWPLRGRAAWAIHAGMRALPAHVR